VKDSTRRLVLGRSRGPSLALGAALALASAVQADGNVTVRVDREGNLIVAGDGADNEIQISPIGIGIGDVTGLGSTQVNGGERASFSGVTGDFRIRMRGGNDRVLVVDGDGNHVPDDLAIDTGTGDDQVLVSGFFVHDDLHVRTGSGADTVELSQTVFVLDRTDVDTGAGDDQVLFVPAEVPDLLIVFEDRFALDTGRGRDFVDIAGALFRGAVSIDLGRGDDSGQLGGPVGGLSVCGSRFESLDVLAQVRFRGGDGEDAAVLESVCGIAPPGLVQDFLGHFESFPDDASFLGGSACSRGCN
jgi:hypothetical protein